MPGLDARSVVADSGCRRLIRDVKRSDMSKSPSAQSASNSAPAVDKVLIVRNLQKCPMVGLPDVGPRDLAMGMQLCG